MSIPNCPSCKTSDFVVRTHFFPMRNIYDDYNCESESYWFCQYCNKQIEEKKEQEWNEYEYSDNYWREGG